MKVVILAGGFGTRISEYTKTIPKPMIPINKKPIKDGDSTLPIFKENSCVINEKKTAKFSFEVPNFLSLNEIVCSFILIFSFLIEYRKSIKTLKPVL